MFVVFIFFFLQEMLTEYKRYNFYLSLIMRKPDFCICVTMTQISFAVTAKLISAFVFATRIVKSLYFLNPKFQASSHLLWLYSPVCVGPGRKPRRPLFSLRGSFKAIVLLGFVHFNFYLKEMYIYKNIKQ